MADSSTSRAIHSNQKARSHPPITAPHHGWFTSPTRSYARSPQGKELPLHLIALILSYLDDVSDLARVTRTSRLFYYMTLPRLYENVTLRSYSELRYVNGRPEGYGNGSPFAMGLNTLVSKNFSDYIQTFRLIGEWREHDMDDYSKGRVPDNSMMLQVAIRAALDKMSNLQVFAWELSTKPLQTVYQSIMAKPSITTLTLRFPTKRIPRPTTVIPPLPNLKTFVVYDIDPLCSPDDISLLLVRADKLENLKMHWSPRMRETGEESINILNYFGRCIAAKKSLPIKRMALYNLYARHSGDDFEHVSDINAAEEITIINSMGSSDPMTVFLDDTWKLSSRHDVPPNLKMMRGDFVDSHHVLMLSRFHGLDRLYMISRRKVKSSAATSPTTPSIPTPSNNGTTSSMSTPVTTDQCKTLAGDYLAVIESNHRTMRHLLLPDHWQLSDETLTRLCQSLPNLEQLAFSCAVPPLDSLRRIVSHCPKLMAMRLLVRPLSELAEKIDAMEVEMHQFALATELWHPEYKNLRYIGLGDKLCFKLGHVIYPSKNRNGATPAPQDNSMNAKRHGPVRTMQRLSWDEIKHVEIWGMDTTEFDPAFP